MRLMPNWNLVTKLKMSARAGFAQRTLGGKGERATLGAGGDEHDLVEEAAVHAVKAFGQGGVAAAVLDIADQAPNHQDK